jgi:hypothetical protein
MRKLTTALGLVLILALGVVATVGRPEPARAATGDNLVLVWNEETLARPCSRWWWWRPSGCFRRMGPG